MLKKKINIKYKRKCENEDIDARVIETKELLQGQTRWKVKK